jgi:DNA segregation ATPase FtsK/SpoIIIE-like protein
MRSYLKQVLISKIKSLEDDIALSLSALGIRIIAPIPVRVLLVLKYLIRIYDGLDEKWFC